MNIAFLQTIILFDIGLLQIGKMKLLGMNIDSKHGVRMEEGME